MEHSYDLDFVVFDTVPHTPIAHPESVMRYGEPLQLHDIPLPCDGNLLYRTPDAISVLSREFLDVGSRLSAPVDAPSHGGVTLGRVLA